MRFMRRPFLSSIACSFLKLRPLRCDGSTRNRQFAIQLHTVLNHRLLGIEAFVTKTIPRRLTGEFVSGLPRS